MKSIFLEDEYANDDYLTEEEVLDIFPEASQEEVEEITATIGMFTDLFFDHLKNETKP